MHILFNQSLLQVWLLDPKRWMGQTCSGPLKKTQEFKISGFWMKPLITDSIHLIFLKLKKNLKHLLHESYRLHLQCYLTVSCWVIILMSIVVHYVIWCTYPISSQEQCQELWFQQSQGVTQNGDTRKTSRPSSSSNFQRTGHYFGNFSAQKAFIFGIYRG